MKSTPTNPRSFEAKFSGASARFLLIASLTLMAFLPLVARAACTLTCPGDITTPAAAGRCDAVVTFQPTTDCTSSGPLRVAILGAPLYPEWNADVSNNIANAYPGAFTIDVINVSYPTASNAVPTLAKLQTYQAVLVFSDRCFNDDVALGNVLADYVDAGGGVVLGTFAFYDSSICLGIHGRFSDDGYSPFTQSSGQQAGTRLFLPSPVPIHDILKGVTSFDGGSSSYHNDPLTLNSGATLVANWYYTNPDVPLIATKKKSDTSGLVVGLNYYPPSTHVTMPFYNGEPLPPRTDFWNPDYPFYSQGGTIMANALILAGQKSGSQASAIVCEPPSGSAFPVGTTPVACSTVDQAAGTVSCGFNITVVDNAPPTIYCPGNLTKQADRHKNYAVVNFKATASDNCGVPILACVPPSGSRFRQGATTLVTCTATDASSNQASCSFAVRVR